MPNTKLQGLMRAGYLPPLSYYFARFVAEGAAAEAAEGTGMDLDGPLGQAAALASLRNLEGDVCVELRHYAGRPLCEVPAEAGPQAPRTPDLDAWRAALSASPWVGGPGGPQPLILDGERLYLGKLWHFEHRVATDINRRLADPMPVDDRRLASGLDRLFPPLTPGVLAARDGGHIGNAGAVSDLDGQRLAAAITLRWRFAVISGGPGTGKTTTVVKVLALLLDQDPGLRIAMAAPTGKAAARLGEAVRRGKAGLDGLAAVLQRIPEEASTLHRLLGLRQGQTPRHHAGNPLPLDCLVVDEASMIDLPLMARLLDGLAARTRLILLGDRDQLASVEAGKVLGDITGHGRDLGLSPAQVHWLESVGAAPPGVLTGDPGAPAAADALGLLRHSYRFSAQGGIGALARAVNAGDGAAALDLLRNGGDELAWQDTAGEDLALSCIDWAAGRYSDYLSRTQVGAALARFEQTRVLAALHQGPFGVETLNRRIAERLQARGLIAGGDEYHGKPVMVTINDYEVGLFNGDIGLLWREADGSLRAWFGGDAGGRAGNGLRSVSLRQLPAHVSAYALTVHKSQGSEFDAVYLVLPATPSPVVTRELIYTGITRARRRVWVQGNPGVFVAGCGLRVERSSALAERLGWRG